MAETSAVERLLRPISSMPWVPPVIVTLFAVVVWAAVGLGPYSGASTPPEYGDFEAQRHWMELTQHLDAKQWYSYDFDWWRLDYPPLTAYHSLICGLVGSAIDQSWFSLDSSRGIENLGIKAYMRATAVVSQLIVYVGPAWLWSGFVAPGLSTRRSIAYAAMLLFPSLTIIDHGHFQFNSVMLGLASSALFALVSRRFVIASILFVLALFFKQMALYYAPAIFAAILGQCIGPSTNWKPNWRRLVSVGVVVIGTGAILLLPFWEGEQLRQIFTRVFPVFRGLWEDKVANLWCTLNYTVLKLKTRFQPSQLQALALAATLIGISPSTVAAFVGGTNAWTWAFANCAWAFYLFSFQVHEKSVLLPLLPTILTMVQHSESQEITAMVAWINNIAYFSMWPLLKREKLQLQYFTLLALYNWLFATKSNWLPSNTLSILAVSSSYASFAALAAAEYLSFIPAEIVERWPDIFVVENMSLSFACFMYFWLWQAWNMISVAIKEQKRSSSIK